MPYPLTTAFFYATFFYKEEKSKRSPLFFSVRRGWWLTVMLLRRSLPERAALAENSSLSGGDVCGLHISSILCKVFPVACVSLSSMFDGQVSLRRFISCEADSFAAFQPAGERFKPYGFTPSAQNWQVIFLSSTPPVSFH